MVGGLGNLGMAGMDDERFYPQNLIPDTEASLVTRKLCMQLTGELKERHWFQSCRLRAQAKETTPKSAMLREGR